MNILLAPQSRRVLLALIVTTIVLGGCGGLLGPSAPPPQIYRLEPVFPAASTSPPVSWQLVVARPTTSQTLDTERIALTRGSAMDYYADAQWNDSVPRLVQSLLVQAFERSNRISAVARESEGLHPDYTLETEIHDFYADYASENAAPSIKIELMLRLVGPGGAVIASREARESVAASANSVPAVVQAFDQAVGAALDQAVNWALLAPPPKAGESK